MAVAVTTYGSLRRSACLRCAVSRCRCGVGWVEQLMSGLQECESGVRRRKRGERLVYMQAG